MLGGGSWWRFLIEKPGELPAQLALFKRSWNKGHSISTLASIGNWIQEHGVSPKVVMVPLSKITLWHPVRGASERGPAGIKTTTRKNNMVAYLNKFKDSSEKISLTEDIFASIPDMKSDDAISTIKVTPLLGDTRRYLKQKIGTAVNKRATRSKISTLKEAIITRKAQRALTSSPDRVSFIVNVPSGLKSYESPEPFFLVSSGQGRLQAIKEAANELGVDSSRIMIQTTVYDVPRNLCSLFVVTGNEYRKDGYFSDPRHATDNIWMPAVESCKKDGLTTDDVLSLYREISYGEGAKYYNAESISSSNYNSNNNLPKAGGRKKTRKQR